MLIMNIKGFPALLSLLCIYTTLAAAVTIQFHSYKDGKDIILSGYFGKETVAKAVDEAGLLAKAVAAMTDASSYATTNRQMKPTALTAFTSDRKTIYYFSAHRGKESGSPEKEPPATSLNIQAEILRALRACEADVVKSGSGAPAKHGNQAKCGEVLSTNQWFIDNPAKTSLAGESQKLIVTVKVSGAIFDPCAGNSKGGFGCNQFLTQLGFKQGQVVFESCAAPSTRRRSLQGRATPKTGTAKKVPGAVPGNSCPLQKPTTPVTKTPVTKTPVTKKPVTKKPVTKKPVTVKKPIKKAPVTNKKTNRRAARDIGTPLNY